MLRPWETGRFKKFKNRSGSWLGMGITISETQRKDTTRTPQQLSDLARSAANQADSAPGTTSNNTMRLPRLAQLLHSDLRELRPCAFKFVVEQPHRIEDFAKCRGSSCAVRLAESENAVVAQELHDPRV